MDESTLADDIGEDDVDAALYENRRLQERLREQYRGICERQERLMALHASLLTARKVDVKFLVSKRAKRLREGEIMLFIDEYMSSIPRKSPFRRAGLYLQSDRMLFAKLPMSKDEARRQEALKVFPSVWYACPLEPYVSDPTGTQQNKEEKKEQDTRLLELLRGYNGPTFGPSFWRLIELPGETRFDTVSRYVSLKLRSSVRTGLDGESGKHEKNEWRDAALVEAVLSNLDDPSGALAAYVEITSTAARIAACRSALIHGKTPSFPSYIWERRKNFLVETAALIRELEVPVVCCSSCNDEEVPFYERFRRDEVMEPSLVDLTACMLALKGKVLGNATKLDEIRRIFLPPFCNFSLTPRVLLCTRVAARHPEGGKSTPRHTFLL
ncbi:hypothetical protein TRVL_03101 [Trypanosoma vivax]|nr:hypothetical protein TRVL_03101 [Trypanosoma vivax]